MKAACTMDTRRIIIHNFARWAAASSARQGSKVRGRKWYDAINRIDFETLFSDECASPEGFGKWHAAEVGTLCRRTGEVVGWAAKILNMVTKVEVYIAELGPPSLKALIHPPIDNMLINAVINEYGRKDSGESREIKTACLKGKPINSITTYARYLQVIEGLRIVADLRGCSLFELESLWDCEKYSGRPLRPGRDARR
jgi:hypothetical protein